MTLNSVTTFLEKFIIASKLDSMMSEQISKEHQIMCTVLDNHFKSCCEAFEFISTSPLLTEDSAKSAISILIHRPQLDDLKRHQIRDITHLLINK